ncbi:MAG: type II CAAX endopeptidase family protein [Dehalococcoidia bacterium]
MPITIAIWTLIFLASLSLLWHRQRTLGLSVLGAGYVLALVDGLLDWRAGIPLALLVAAAYAVAPERRRPWRIGGHVVFVVVALGLGFHLLPGFQNLQVIGPVRFTPDAVPFTMYLNLDKPLAGFWLLLVWPALRLHRGRWSWIRGLLIGFATAVVCLGLAITLGEVALAPKWPPLGWLWALNNLLLVCLTEEAVFRGYLQEELSRRLTGRRAGEGFAIGIAAALFGLAHLAGGVGYVIVAGVAGVGYGLAYRHGGLQASAMAHFGLNLVHFSLFTYPMLAS